MELTGVLVNTELVVNSALTEVGARVVVVVVNGCSELD